MNRPPRIQPVLAALGLVLVLANSLRAAPAGRPGIELSGEWEFRLDPRDEGVAQRWFDTPTAFPRRVVVPGAWNAQGIGFETAADLAAYQPPPTRPVISGPGTETNKLFHVFPGPGWYRRRVAIPAEWESRRIWLTFGGVHRTAEVWVDGTPVGSHVGYVVPFRFDVTRHVRPGRPAVITVRVDARRNPEIDPLMGCVDTLDFLFVQWGGLHRDVRLETTAERWIDDVFVVPQVADGQAEVRITPGGDPSVDAGGTSAAAVVELLDSEGQVVVRDRQPMPTHTNAPVAIRLSVPKPRLWSPDHPHLYQARVTLLRGDQVLDTRSVRFGLREFVVRDGRFLLNGTPLFLRGYGDDCIYPDTIAPPVDRAEYRRRFQVVKDHGFNYVRHHSWCPPEEYLDVADEMGVLVQPEFPQAYRWELARTPAARERALDLWARMVVTHRNHPSIAAWCMGNELYDGFPDAPAMYRQARDLDPTRPVIDSDGISRTPRDTLDFWVWQFAENTLGYLNAKYRFDPTPKPVVAHEMGYFVTLPDLDQLPLFGRGLRPYWLHEARDLAERKGLAREYPAWLTNSYRLQAECLKVNMEAARRSNLQGYSCWLFQDYPWCAEGVVDMFFRPKALSGPEFRQFNGPTVLLLDHDPRTFRSGQPAEMKMLLACDEPDLAGPATFSWRLRHDDGTPVAAGSRPDVVVTPGHRQELGPVRFTFPDTASARRLTLEARLDQGHQSRSNHWKLWVFPPLRPLPPGVAFTHAEAVEKLYVGDTPSPAPATTTHPGPTLRVTGRWDDVTRRALESGGSVLLLAPEAAFPTVAAGFRPAGWDPSSREANLGTVFDPDHPALRDVPSEGWCDLRFYRLIEGGKTVLLDEIAPGLSPIVRCIDMPQRLGNRAFLFEARVGRGKLLVSGFNFTAALAANDPAAAHLVDQFIRYALGPEFAPRQELALPTNTVTTYDLGTRRVTVTHLDFLPLVDSEYTRRFRFDRHDNPKLAELRRRHHLDEVVAPGRDEFDRQILLLDWTHRQFERFGQPSTGARGALDVLAAVEAGHAFFCAQYAEVLVSAAASLGWIDRPLALRRHQGVARVGGSTEHSVTEIWSNQHRKWVMLDPTSNLHLEKDGVPLNAFEIRTEWFYRNGTNLVFVVGKERKRYRKSDLPIALAHFEGFGDLAIHPDELDKYGFLGFIPNTDLMDSGYDYGGMFIVKDALCDGTVWHTRTLPGNPAVDPYFPVGQAALILRAQAGELRVSLGTFTPNFHRFEVRFDDGEWTPAAPDFVWPVHPGPNRLEARTVNRFGVAGSPSRAEVSATP